MYTDRDNYNQRVTGDKALSPTLSAICFDCPNEDCGLAPPKTIPDPPTPYLHISQHPPSLQPISNPPNPIQGRGIS